MNVDITEPLYDTDEVYWCPGTVVKFLVEQKLFKVSRHQFVVGSEYFAKLHGLREDDDDIVQLEGVTVDQFSVFLKIVFPVVDYSNPTVINFTTEEWLLIFRLSSQWRFNGIRNLAIQHLIKELSALSLVKLGRAENVPEFLMAGYRAFVDRKNEITTEKGDITDEEALGLGLKTVNILWRIRYHAEGPENEGRVEQFIKGELKAKFATEISTLEASGNAARALEDLDLEDRLAKLAEERRRCREEEGRLAVEKSVAQDGRIEGAVDASEAEGLKAEIQLLRQELEARTRQLERAEELNNINCVSGRACISKRARKRDLIDQEREEEARVQLEIDMRVAEEERAARQLEAEKREEEKRRLEALLVEERQRKEAVKLREELEELRAWKRERMLEEATIDEILQDADEED
ncbi:hypothetical protein DFP72DRAFT_31355 [Ephemerocybe angulata]|uniref:BTB domain-containing protein n=1 Tax=Ephemerocybe angulata TaxID=980116 RepID=A0A8H6IC29_9AGAR|nr:hypothetical protein DFP72DRAFT_31355 [Tulosesus angulatus]